MHEKCGQELSALIVGIAVNTHAKFQFNTGTGYKDISLIVVARKTLTNLQHGHGHRRTSDCNSPPYSPNS